MTATTAIHIKNSTLAYHGMPVFSNLNLSLRTGKWTALLGPSGVGKSSLLRFIADLTTPEETASGTVVNDHNQPIHTQIAWMGQSDMLMPWLTIIDNLTIGLSLRGEAREKIAAGKLKALQLLLMAGLSHAGKLFPYQLSGGMRQRVALLRTLMEDKPIVLMDEPFSALDAFTRYQLHQVAIELLQNKTVLFVTHDPNEALRLADDIYLLSTSGLQHLATLNSSAPRLPHDPEANALQALIYEKIMQHAEVA